MTGSPAEGIAHRDLVLGGSVVDAAGRSRAGSVSGEEVGAPPVDVAGQICAAPRAGGRTCDRQEAGRQVLER